MRSIVLLICWWSCREKSNLFSLLDFLCGLWPALHRLSLRRGGLQTHTHTHQSKLFIGNDYFLYFQNRPIHLLIHDLLCAWRWWEKAQSDKPDEVREKRLNQDTAQTCTVLLLPLEITTHTLLKTKHVTLILKCWHFPSLNHHSLIPHRSNT